MLKKILILTLFALIVPSLVKAKEVSFSDAKLWNYLIDQQITDFSFTKQAITDWQSFQITTIDLGKDNNQELVLASGKGQGPEIKILDITGREISSWLAYNENMLNGVEVAVADLNNDNKDEIITGVGDGAGAHVRIFNSAGEPVLGGGWFAWTEENRGVKIAVVQADNDSQLEIATAIYKDQKVLVKIYDYDGRLKSEFVVNEDLGIDFKITNIDLGGDGRSEIILSAGEGQQPNVYLYRTDGSLINNWLAYEDKFIGGFQVKAIDLNQDGKNEIITVPQLSGGPHLKVFDGFGNLQIELMLNNQDMLAGYNFTIINNQVLFIPSRQTTGRVDLAKYIVIDISDQKLNFFNYYGIQTASMLVSTGTVQMPTPLGEYTIDYKEPNRFSRTYGLYMPFWMAFNVQKGYGLHELPYWPSGYKEGVDHLGQRVSHGCVRLGVGDAEKIYNQTPLGTKVFIQQ